MKKNFMKLLAVAQGLFSARKLDGKENLQLTEEEKQSLDAETKTEGIAEKFEAYYNAKFVAEQQEETSAFAQFMQGFDEAMQANGITTSAEQEEGEEGEEPTIPSADAKTASEKLKATLAAGKKLLKTNAALAADNEKLKVIPEPDVPEAVINIPGTKMNTVKHSATHLFASNNSWDSLDREWNRNATGITPDNVKAATVWDKVNIDKLNQDLGAYSRRNSNEIMSMLMDGYDIPAHWSVISNVQDQMVFSSIATGEITQGFKKSWLPKNKARFVPVINKIFDKQIDITWAPSELKAIEKSWLNMFFNEGSTPYKMSFARYLLAELLKRARKEDKIALFKAVYFDTENLPAGTAGSFLNSMDGFLKLVDDNRNVNYAPYDLPVLTPTNTFDVIQDLLENKLPIDVRNMPGLKLGLGTDVHRWYWQDRERQKGVYQDYEKQTMSPQEFSNIDFVKHVQLDGTGFIYLTTEDNIGLMIDRPGEEALLTIELDKREINVFADYKQGVYIKAFGAKVDPAAPLDFEDQIFFSNNVPLLNTTYIPVQPNDATPSVADHQSLLIGSTNTAATSITALDDVVEGTRYYLQGDSDTNVSTVTATANIILDGGSFALSKGNVIELLGLSGGRVIEVSRTVSGSVPAPTKFGLAANATTANAADGTYFVTAVNSAATALTNIENAVKDEVYTIEGNASAGANATTIANGGNFLLTAAFTASAGATLTVVYNGAKFVETGRA